MKNSRLIQGVRLLIIAAFLAAPGLLAQQALGPGGESGARYEITVSKDVMVPMRDGVRLATDIYRPVLNGAPVAGKFPVILERTPYNKNGIEEWARYFVSRGYVAVGQDTRGRYGSEGRWRPHRDDVNDGYDTAKWIGEQPWSNGNIGTVGTSYPGGTQHALALSNPPSLKAMIPVDAMSDYGRYGIRHNGAFELRWMNWIFNIGLPDGTREGRDPATRQALITLGEQVREYARSLPLRRGTTPLRLAPDYEAWLVEAMNHGDNDEFWKDMGASVIDHLDEYKDVPVYLVGGWYDSWGLQTANLNYVELSKAKKGPIRLIMGPWTHGGQTQSFAGEAEFGPEAALDFNAFRQRWFDRWLKGIQNGVDRGPPVRIFVMGGGDGRRTPEGRVFVGGTGGMSPNGRWLAPRPRPITCSPRARFLLKSRLGHRRRSRRRVIFSTRAIPSRLSAGTFLRRESSCSVARRSSAAGGSSGCARTRARFQRGMTSWCFRRRLSTGTSK